MLVKCPNQHDAEVLAIIGQCTVLSIHIRCRYCKETYQYVLSQMDQCFEQAAVGKKRAEKREGEYVSMDDSMDLQGR